MKFRGMRTATAVLSAALLVSACERIEKKEPESIEIRLQVPTLSDDPIGSKPYQDAAERFHQLNPSVTVKIDYATLKPGATSVEIELVKLLQSDEPPDIVTIPQYRVPSVAKQDLLLDLLTLQQTAGPREMGIPQRILDLSTTHGKLLTLPYSFSPYAVYYNKQLFDQSQIPYPNGVWTWEEFRDVSRKLKAPYGSILAYDIWTLDTLMASTSQGLLSPDGTTAVGYLDSPETVRAIGWLNDYYKDDAGKKGPMGFNDSFERFRDHQAAMIVSDFNPQFADSAKYGAAPLPHFASGKRTNPIEFVGFGIARKSKHPKEAWEFLQHLVLNKNEDSTRFAQHLLTTNQTIAETTGQRTDPIKRTFHDEMNYSVIPSLSSNPYIVKAWNTDLQEKFGKLLAMSDAELQPWLHDLALKLDQELRRLEDAAKQAISSSPPAR